MCVCEREREKKRTFVCMCVCERVCVCVCFATWRTVSFIFSTKIVKSLLMGNLFSFFNFI